MDEYFGTHDPIPCPYCKETNSDLWEIAPGGDGDTVLCACGNCGKELEYTARYTFELCVKKALPCVAGCGGYSSSYRGLCDKCYSKQQVEHFRLLHQTAK